jgi:DNA polymerase III delta prime subunit
MTDLFEEEVRDEQPVHSLWVEKYRPSGLDKYIGNEQLKQTVDTFIEKNDIPHLLLYGGAGTGKTTLAKLITKNINCDVIYINASDETGVDNIRNRLKTFASSAGFKPLKVVILDEGDYLSSASQACLRNLMETFSAFTRFIITCNYYEKIIPALISRCQVYQINPISKKEVAVHLTKILDTEKVSYTPDDIGYIVNTYYPDIRKVINFSQQSVVNGKIKIAKENAAKTDIHEKLIFQLKNGIGKPSAFNEIRQFIADADINKFDEYFELLYNKVDEYAPGKQVIATVVIAEYMYQSALVVSALKEISFMACISKLLTDLRK